MTEEYTWPMTVLVHSAWHEFIYAVNEGIETKGAADFRTLNRGVIPAIKCKIRILAKLPAS